MKIIRTMINKGVPDWVLTLVVTLYFLCVFNSNFFATVQQLHGSTGASAFLYLASLFVFLLVVINVLLTMVSFPWVLKPVLMVLIVGACVTAYFMDTYNIMIDKEMIRNAVETDAAESLELMSTKLVGYLVFLGIIPAMLVAKSKIRFESPIRFILTKAVVFVVSTVVVVLISLEFYQDYASLFRNNRYVRNLIVPVNYLYAIQSWSKSLTPKMDVPIEKIGDDVRLGASWAQPGKRMVSVIVVGETARSASFSLFGYDRLTNPKLSQKDVVSFSNVHSCGTATAVSVPCMFSNMNREDFDLSQAKSQENLLDILQRSGLKVIWIDNNSGCKGVCDRVGSIKITPATHASDCEGQECYDMALLKQLQVAVESEPEDMVIVLHQKGSHGPAYSLRAPKEFLAFTPYCETNQLQECSQQEIVNAYDNTILYTDYFLSSVIDYLQEQSDAIDTNMIYVSDHGESLGERNLYLHGLPYQFAPAEQTHVPMVVWMNTGFANRFGIDGECLSGSKQVYLEHDHLFHSVLGSLDIETTEYQADKNLFRPCQGAYQVAKARKTVSKSLTQITF